MILVHVNKQCRIKKTNLESENLGFANSVPDTIFFRLVLYQEKEKFWRIITTIITNANR